MTAPSDSNAPPASPSTSARADARANTCADATPSDPGVQNLGQSGPQPSQAGQSGSALSGSGLDELSQLGAASGVPASPEAAILETAPNPHEGTLYLARFTAPEFTSLCPVTGQPDFAHLVIDYVPAARIIESKSLKLFMTSFRNHGAFHEDCTVMIAKRLVEAAAPQWLRIGGYWYPRGGIPIDIFYQTGAPPEGLWLPDQNVPAYRGRG